ncbi:MAG: RHS repeat-associated core domain-containing protein [Rhodobacteraceae bacterium]|nr:RHS repeat-associated core domain-containing protein [Paracoccaceae bacterium]
MTRRVAWPVFATNDLGMKVWEASYLPFGGVHVATGGIDLRFPGQWFQAESGLHQNWMRDYDPTTGRYIEADPLGLVDGASIYGYVRQNPGRYIDPFGLEAWDWDGHGNVVVCQYYDRQAAASPTCEYYRAAAEICRGENRVVNVLTDFAIRQSWSRGGNNSSQSEIYDRIRQKLIFYDYQNRNLGNVGDDGCVCGDDIDLYHLMSFSETGLNNAFYGGNWWPHSVWPNPVPRN